MLSATYKKYPTKTRIKTLCGCTVMAMISGCGGGGASGSNVTSTNAPVIDNKPPSAVIDSLTPDYIAGRAVELTSASSTDEDGDALSIEWQFDSPSGSYAALKKVGTNVVQFEPDMAGTFTIRLEVQQVA